MRSVTPTGLAELLDAQPRPQLLDVREPWEYDLCHIDGSVNIPMGELMGRLDDIPRDAAVIVICHHGARSGQVAAYLDSLGYADVTNLEGGVDAWSRDIDPEMPQY